MKAQSSIVYLLITIAIALILASGVYFSAYFFKAKLNENILEQSAEEILQRVHNGLLKMRTLYNQNATNISITINIPSQIGEQKYTITGLGNKIELRTFGNPSVIKTTEINYWQNISIQGLVGSEKEKLRLNLINESTILIY
ncbi:MAG: hypothetical protein QW625_00425 [Candidatus Nanoarchaeia archaeon]